MELLELRLKHYGKFEDHRIALKSGVNVIYGGNEAGKSTVHSFVKAMLFGLDSEEFSLRRPWRNPADFSGSMTLREDGISYEIERNFDSRSAGLKLRDPKYGTELPDPGLRLAELNVISEEAFCNTVFLKQGCWEAEASLSERIRRCAASGGNGAAETDVNAAIRTLRRRKAEAEQKKKREEEQIETQIEKKQTEAEYLRREIQVLKRQCEYLRGQRAEYEEEEDEDASFWKRLLRPAGRKDAREDETEAADLERARHLRAEIVKRENRYQKLQEELETLCHRQVKTETVQTEIAALQLAIERICDLADEMYGMYGGSLNRRAGQILGELTGGRYTRLRLDDTGSLRIGIDGGLSELCRVGDATRQQAWFAVRMAAGEFLLKGRSLPLLLDEPFVMYDEERLEAALRWLHRSGRQVLLFTSQPRVRILMDKIRLQESQISGIQEAENSIK